MEDKDRISLAALTLVPFVMVLGNSMLVPVLPTIKRELGLGLAEVGLLITCFSLPAGVVIPFAGFASDRIGRKTVMVPALLVYGTGGILAGLAGLLSSRPYYLLLGARVVQGLGAGGTYQLALALTGDEIQGRERAGALGLLEAANGLGKVASPLLGAGLALLGWTAPFFFYGLLAFPVAFIVARLARESRSGGSTPPMLGDYFREFARILRAKGGGLAVVFSAGMAVLFGIFGTLSLFSDLLEEIFGMGVFARGAVLAVPVGLMAAVSFTLGMALKKNPRGLARPFLFLGLVVGAVGLALFGLVATERLALLLVAVILVGLGTGAVLPPVNTLVIGAAPRAERGGLACLYGTLRFLGVALGPPVFALGAGKGRLPLFLGVAGGLALLAALAFLLVKPEKILPAERKPAA
ncbi:MAG: MFS transporter [Bacillota bacterium]